ncbi:MAG: sulfotransferase family protein [Bacteroidota bacterium]
MKLTAEYLDNLPVHFVLCTERTGSSLFSLMLNLHPNILSPSEEPFALYFWRKYKNKTSWTEKDIANYVDSFFLISEKNTDLYFSKKKVFIRNLIANQDILNFERIIKITYLHFIDVKDKSQVTCIVDKQIKYFFHLELIQQIFPSAKYIVLTRDVRDNIVSKSNRKLNWNQNPYFLACLWNDTYDNISNLKSDKYLVISYESLITNMETTLKTVCEWFGLTFYPKMKETDGVYDAFLNQKKNDVDPDFLKRLQNFHSGLSQKPNSNKIGQYKNVLNSNTIRMIEIICGKNLEKLGYQIETIGLRKTTFEIMYYKILAKLYRRYLLTIYFQIPLSLKLMIKKIRGKKSVV